MFLNRAGEGHCSWRQSATVLTSSGSPVVHISKPLKHASSIPQRGAVAGDHHQPDTSLQMTFPPLQRRFYSTWKTPALWPRSYPTYPPLVLFFILFYHTHTHIHTRALSWDRNLFQNLKPIFPYRQKWCIKIIKKNSIQKKKTALTTHVKICPKQTILPTSNLFYITSHICFQ